MDITVYLLILIALINLGNGQDALDRDNRVVGGMESRPHQFPFLVALILSVRDGSQSFCGGSIIGPNYILTAAHCIENVVKMDVMAGIHDVFNGQPIFHTVVYQRDFLMHFAYNSDTLENDIALVYLQTPIPLSNLMKTVSLPTYNQAMNQFTGTLITIAGWGKYSDASASLSSTLRFVQTPVISNEECRRTYMSYIKPTNICVSGARGRSSCNGDSGSGVTAMMNGKLVLLGVVSFGVENCEGGFPSGFTRVTSYLNWIYTNADIWIY
ncbi:unnamed protein product [Diamesa hyperborea]